MTDQFDFAKAFRQWSSEALKPAQTAAFHYTLSSLSPVTQYRLLTMGNNQKWDANKMLAALKVVSGVDANMIRNIEAVLGPATPGPSLVVPPPGYQPMPSGDLGSDSMTTPMSYGAPSRTGAPNSAYKDSASAAKVAKPEKRKRKISDLWSKEVEEETPSRSASATPAAKNNNGKYAKWALVILLVLIIMISVGAFFKLNSSSEDQFSYSSDTPFVTDGLTPTTPGQSLAPGETEECSLATGERGIKRYVLVPIPTQQPNRGFANELLTVRNENTTALDPGHTYYAIKVGGSYLVAVEMNATAYFPLTDFVTNPGYECVDQTAGGILTLQLEKAVEEPSVELVYRLDLGHWTGLMVSISIIAVTIFALISLSLTGNGRWDILLFVIAVVGTLVLSKLFSLFIFYVRPLFPYLSSTAVLTVENIIVGIFATMIVISLAWSVSAGSKSETRQFSDQYKAGSQFSVPKSYQPIFDSLTKGWGLIGGFDFTLTIVFLAFFAVAGALDLTASPFYLVFHNQIAAVSLLGLLVIFFAALETYRRGMSEDWFSFASGFVGLLDFPLLLWLFGNNPPAFQSMTPAAMAVIISLVLFVAVFGLNFWFQADGDRMELARDRMADGMLFYSVMKLVAILLYIFMFLL